MGELTAAWGSVHKAHGMKKPYFQRGQGPPVDQQGLGGLSSLVEPRRNPWLQTPPHTSIHTPKIGIQAPPGPHAWPLPQKLGTMLDIIKVKPNPFVPYLGSQIT